MFSEEHFDLLLPPSYRAKYGSCKEEVDLEKKKKLNSHL